MLKEIISGNVEINYFKTDTNLCKALTLKLARIINNKNLVSRIPTIALSGGNTPDKFYTFLFNTDLFKKKTRILLADERIVSNSHPKRNSNLIKSKLINKRKNILIRELNHVNFSEDKDIYNYNPLELIVLGMGLDGHLASIFTEKEIDQKYSNFRFSNLEVTKKRNESFKRISLSLDIINNSRVRILYIKGAKKIELLKKILQDNIDDYPISKILQKKLTVYWSPN